MGLLMFINYFNFVLFVIFALCYCYQIFYVIVVLFSGKKKRQQPPANQLHRYAVLITARNEQNVIASLIESIQGQRYPKELLDIFVVADNCTDDTAFSRRTSNSPWTALYAEKRLVIAQQRYFMMNNHALFRSLGHSACAGLKVSIKCCRYTAGHFSNPFSKKIHIRYHVSICS